MTTTVTTERQIAVLIDFENVGLSSIQWLFDQVSDIGRITIKRAYADWADKRNKAAGEQLLQLGIEQIHRPPTAASGKNSSDIKLVIDAVELAYQSPIDTFVIASSDSDFAPLVSKLRASGKVVIGAGRREATSQTLVISCDRFFYLESEQAQPKKAKRGRPPKRQQQPTNDLLRRAVEASIDEHGRVVGSRLHSTMQRLDPGFSFRSLGHSTFTKYLEASPQVKVTRPGGSGDMTVELAEHATATPPAQTPPPEKPQEAPSAPAADDPAPDAWGPRIDDIWQVRTGEPGGRIPGPRAASDAAQVLGVSKLSVSPYKTLEKLLDASEYLSARWKRDGNNVVRR